MGRRVSEPVPVTANGLTAQKVGRWWQIVRQYQGTEFLQPLYRIVKGKYRPVRFSTRWQAVEYLLEDAKQKAA